ncbi:MAG: GntR family transcriptional regulator, partial [Micromonosporaceae bacterium]
MDLHLHLGEKGGLAEQIYAQLHERISTDALPAGTVLPSSRELAARLSVSRATVVAAYEHLAVPAAEFDFAPGVPARTRFPFARWRALLNDQLRTRTEVHYA